MGARAKRQSAIRRSPTRILGSRSGRPVYPSAPHEVACAAPRPFDPGCGPPRSASSGRLAVRRLAAVLRAAADDARADRRRRRARRGRTAALDAGPALGLRPAAAALHLAAMGVLPGLRRVDLRAGADEEPAAARHLQLHLAGGAAPGRAAAGGVVGGVAAAADADRLGIAARPDALGAGHHLGRGHAGAGGRAAAPAAQWAVPAARRGGGLRAARQVQLRAVHRRLRRRAAVDARHAPRAAGPAAAAQHRGRAAAGRAARAVGRRPPGRGRQQHRRQAVGRPDARRRPDRARPAQPGRHLAVVPGAAVAGAGAAVRARAVGAPRWPRPGDGRPVRALFGDAAGLADGHRRDRRGLAFQRPLAAAAAVLRTADVLRRLARIDSTPAPALAGLGRRGDGAADADAAVLAPVVRRSARPRR